jgi:hypothetical protein
MSRERTLTKKSQTGVIILAGTDVFVHAVEIFHEFNQTRILKVTDSITLHINVI